MQTCQRIAIVSVCLSDVLAGCRFELKAPQTPTAKPVLTQAPPATSRPSPLPSATTSADGKWVLYTNTALGFSFEYPALFEQPAYQTTCGLKAYDDRVVVADQIAIWSEPGDGRTQDQLADELIAKGDWKEEGRHVVPPGDRLQVDFRFGGANAFGTMTIATFEERLYVIDFQAGTLNCEVPDQAVGRFEALARIAETLQGFAPRP